MFLPVQFLNMNCFELWSLPQQEPEEPEPKEPKEKVKRKEAAKKARMTWVWPKWWLVGWMMDEPGEDYTFPESFPSLRAGQLLQLQAKGPETSWHRYYDPSPARAKSWEKLYPRLS